jgi:enoyl-CoA hydratase
VTVTLERGEHGLTAVMDDGKANALTFEAIAGLRSALTTSIEEKAPLVIAGRSGCFSAGFDLRIMRSGDRDLVASLADEGFLLFRQLFSAPVPVIAACTGHALAAGALLLLASDYRIGPFGTYQIGLNEIRIGIALPQPAVDMARFRLNPVHLMAATLFATVVAPEQACAVGYLDRVDPDPRAAALATAADIASADLRAFARTKQRMHAEIIGRLSEAANRQTQL